MNITLEDIERSRQVGREFRERFMPLINLWIDDCAARGNDLEIIMIGLSAETLAMSTSAHIGSGAMFLKMAQSAIAARAEWAAMH